MRYRDQSFGKAPIGQLAPKDPLAVYHMPVFKSGNIRDVRNSVFLRHAFGRRPCNLTRLGEAIQQFAQQQAFARCQPLGGIKVSPQSDR